MRRKTRTINVGGVKIGSHFPVRIQSMTKTDTRDVRKTVAQIKELEKCGCEIVRVAVKDKLAARAIKKIKRKIRVPLVADIHFDFHLALEAIKNNADKIRINPGNISNPEHLKEIIGAAKKKRVPIRIGLNSGSLVPMDESLPAGQAGTKGRKDDSFIKTALKYIKFFEKQDFHDIIISLKSSSVPETVSVYRKLAVLCDYPLHLGVTAAGSYNTGIVKSAIGIGALLLDGIGDTIRVSLTEDPVEEVIAAKRILQAVDVRRFGPEIISCPTCGRCQVDLLRITAALESAFRGTRDEGRGTNVKIAVMGCEVNGPGEAREADVGIAFGKGFGMLFKKGKIIKKIKTRNAVKELLKCVGHKP
ncbi:MAG: flavodoxin-dependent (E)-4-hydroxy-3-methylbut-2-enyl-diphosphate synthase [Candidatus Omnitrophica bacterium]|nr:flavodoxin-dependent (E)-4-hydroxy-3-methylbut-2-enyl-diphosphate synthase [Candidatus Omnitrophota bacterium]